MTGPPTPRPGRLVRLGIVLRAADGDDRRRLARMADLAGVDVVWAADSAEVVALLPLVGRADVLIRPEVDEPWARTLGVSIGRTPAEAEARIELDPTLAEIADPRTGGLFGTLADCQARVVELAHAGVVDLRCVLPDVADVHDLVAQLTAAVVGDPATHRPDAPRTPDPEPPPWAGRRIGG